MAWARNEDPAALAAHLRAIYRDYAFNSPLVCVISVYLYLAWDGPRPWTLLQIWFSFWMVYMALRFWAGWTYSMQKEEGRYSLVTWSRLSLFIQLVDGLFIAALALFIYPQFDPLAQSAVLAATLVLVGATAFSLAGRWLAIWVYAPTVYLSFAWMTWQQKHEYSQGFALFTLGMFVLYLVFASNQRKSLHKGFELAKRNGELAAELQSKNLELREVAVGRSRLLATVSHDLRQPAHAIGLLAERALVDSSTASIRQSLRDLNELSQSLSASLTTLMDLTRLDAGLVEPRSVPVALVNLLARLQSEFEPAARSKGLRLLVRPSVAWVSSDPVLLYGLLANLVANAIKYTAHGAVELTLSPADRQICLSVSDTGIGIHQDRLDQIFNEFVRLDARESGSEGLGLGLSIVRRYALMLGHRLSVESTPERGSRFSLLLPLCEPGRDQARAAPRASQEQLGGLRVLVVDNVDLLLSSMVKTLSAWSCQVCAARNLVEAIDATGNLEIDLLISDYHLGDFEPNGLQLIQTMRSRAVRAIPALLMTGDVSAQLEAQAQLQDVRVVHKPVRPAVLRAQVLALIEPAAQSPEPGQSPQAGKPG
jgi:signal transduction histidine kinase/CheY-like chemotaxis protein